MEITLEKIELVKDRTGVSYAEAKRALEEADGSVIDAIIMIEEKIDIAPKTKAGNQASQIVEKLKELVKKGNVSKILIKKDNEVIMNIPVNVGILGAIFIPWVTVISVIAALGTKCSIELIKDNGEVVNLSDKACETFDGVKSNYSVIADDLKEKGEDTISQVKEKASSVMSRVKKESCDMEEDDYFNFDDFDDSIFDEGPKEEGLKEKAKAAADKVKDKASDLKDAAEDIADKAKDRADDLKDAAEDVADKMKDKAEDAADRVEERFERASDSLKEKLDSADEKFEETIEDYKAKKNKFRFFE